MSILWTNFTVPRGTSAGAAAALIDSRTGFLRNKYYGVPRLSFLNQTRRRDARVCHRV